ncbi:MAG: TRAP transporter small permease [Pseudomonadota bacterium]
MKKILEFLCGVLAGAALFGIMALTFFDVLGRKFFDHSIPGSLELTELMMVVVIFAALPLVSERREHVAFDSLDHYLPGWVLRAQSIAVNLLCAGVLIGLGWLMIRTGNQFLETGETTAQLKILKAPFIWGMGALCAFTGVVHLVIAGTPPVDYAHRAEGEGAAL